MYLFTFQWTDITGIENRYVINVILLNETAARQNSCLWSPYGQIALWELPLREQYPFDLNRHSVKLVKNTQGPFGGCPEKRILMSPMLLVSKPSQASPATLKTNELWHNQRLSHLFISISPVQLNRQIPIGHLLPVRMLVLGWFIHYLSRYLETVNKSMK